MSPEIIIALMFIIFILGIFSGFPIAFVLAAVGIGFGLTEWGLLSFQMFTMQVFGVMNNSILLAIPLFIFMANFLVRSGVSDRLFSTTPYLFGPIRGGLGVSVILFSTLMAACTGIVGASVTSMGLTALPVMLKSGYKRELSLGTVSAGGSLGILIPPSIMLVVIGPYASISVGKLFAAAMLPGLLLGALYIFYLFLTCWIHPEYGPALSSEDRAALPIRKRLILILANVTPTLILILGVLGSIFFGVATVTEAAAVGVFLAFVLVLAYRQYSWKSMQTILLSTAKTSTMVLATLIGASCFTTTLFGIGGKQIIADAMLGLNLGKWGLIIIIIAIVFLLGLVMDWVEIVPICFPIFLPIVIHAGFNPLWFSVIIAMTLQTAFLSPPVGAALFYLKGVAPPEITMMHIIRGIIPFTAIVLFGVLMCALFPELILWLPERTFG